MAGGPQRGRPGGRAVIATVMASVTASAVLVVAYYQAPLDRPLDAASGWLLLVALLLYGAIMAFELWRIVRSAQPRLRAVRALSVGLPLLLVLFASTYCTVAGQDPAAFSEPLSRTDGLYFTVTVFSTVGFGDIAPVTETARVLVTVQILVGMLVLGLIAKLVVGAVQLAVHRRGPSPDAAADGAASPGPLVRTAGVPGPRRGPG